MKIIKETKKNTSIDPEADGMELDLSLYPPTVSPELGISEDYRNTQNTIITQRIKDELEGYRSFNENSKIIIKNDKIYAATNYANNNVSVNKKSDPNIQNEKKVLEDDTLLEKYISKKASSIKAGRNMEEENMKKK